MSIFKRAISNIILVLFLIILPSVWCVSIVKASDMSDCLQFKYEQLLGKHGPIKNLYTKSLENKSDIINSNFTFKNTSPDISTLAVVPTNENEFKMIFGLEPTKSRLKEMSKAKNKLNELDMPTKFTNNNWQREDFEKYLQDNESPFVAILGHNEDGIFRLSDSSEIGLTDMGIICEQNNKNCIFVSCSSSDWVKNPQQLSIEPSISYEEAVLIVKKLQSHLSSLEQKRKGSNLPLTACL